MKSKLLKKILLITLVLTFILTATIGAATLTFTDIKDSWAKEYIERVADYGIVTGYDDRTFRPDDNVTIMQAMIMMSRLYNLNDDVKENIIDKYKPKLEKMPNVLYNEWAFDDLALVIGLNIVSEEGMEDMFLDKTIFQVATKEQVAILLANAMMLSDEAKELKVYSLPFKDRDNISAVAKPYIYVLYDNDILQGDNEKNINPQDKITRAVMATMIDRAYDYIEENEISPVLDDYKLTTTHDGLLVKIDDGSKESYLTIRKDNEDKVIIKINDTTKIYLNDDEAKFSDLEEDMILKCKIDDKTGVAISVEADDSVEVVRGIIDLVQYVTPAKITITDEEDDDYTYNVSSDVDIYHDGEVTKLKDLDENDEVTLLIEDDKLYQISSTSRIKHYEGEITSINYGYPIKMTFKTVDNEELVFEYTSKVDITRNEDESSFDQIRIGDNATFTTKYGELISIDTTAKESELSGTIKEILIASPQNKIKIADEDGNIAQYLVNNNIKINIGSKNSTIYDLRIGYLVDVNTVGDEIVTMEVSEIQAYKNFSGKVIFVNVDDNLVMIQNIKDNGQTELVYLRIPSSTLIFDTAGSEREIEDIEEGENILSTAYSLGGEYVAVSIIVQ